jgi:uncharacterized RDD family membrane protein YckC
MFAVVILAAAVKAPPLAFLGLVVIIIAGGCYQPYMWWSRGATIGQKALGLRVVRAIDGGPITGGTAVVRLVGMFVSAWVFYLGLIWVAFDSRKRGWHDMMADTFVIHVG